jgi:hypothetical protein
MCHGDKFEHSCRYVLPFKPLTAQPVHPDNIVDRSLVRT